MFLLLIHLEALFCSNTDAIFRALDILDTCEADRLSLEERGWTDPSFDKISSQL